MNRIRDHVARYMLRSARGQGLLDKIIDPIRDILDGTVYLFALKGLFGVSLPYYALVLIVTVKKGLEVLIGYMDEHWGFWKAENWYTSYMLNDFNKELMDRIKNIERKL